MDVTIGPDRHPIAAPIIIYDHEVPASGRDRAFAPTFHTLWWVRQGWAEVAGKFGRIRIPAGRGIFMSPGIHRRQTFAQTTRMLSLSFVISWEDGQPLLESLPPKIYRQAGADDLVAPAEAVSAANGDSHRSPECWMAFQAAFQTFLAAALRWTARQGFQILEPTHCDPRLARVVEEIRRQPTAGPLPFGHWERRAGLSRSQISRLARAQLGESLHAYRNRILTEALRKQLLTNRASTKEIAAAFGFVDSAHLCHWLRHHTGSSPAELRHHSA